MESVARKLLETVKRIAPERYELRPATAHSHPHVDWTAYERMRQVMAGLGFWLLGDFEPVGQTAVGKMTHANVLRIFISHDAITTAAFYRMALRWTPSGIRARLRGGGRGTLDLMTAFTDGTSLETSTAPLVGRWQNPPFLLKEFQPQMHPAALLARHLQRIGEQMQWNPAARPYRVSTLEQVVAMGQSTTQRKRQFRQSIGWITREELAGFGKLQPAQLDRIHAEIRRLVAMEAAAAPAPPPARPQSPAPPQQPAPAPMRAWTPPPPPSGNPSPPPQTSAGAPPQAPPSPEPATPAPAEPPRPSASPESAAPVPAAAPPASADESIAQPSSEGASVDEQPVVDAIASAQPGSSADGGRVDVDASWEDASGDAEIRADASLSDARAPADSPSVQAARKVEEVTGRALVMNALINVHFRAPVEVVRRWIEANGAAEHLSPRERALLAKPNAEVTPEEHAKLRGYIEALWALLWAGGVADGLAPGQPVPAHMATLVPNLKTNEDASKLRQRMHLRSTDEVAAMRARYERVHASLSDGASLPYVDAAVVQARRKALEWLMDPALGWDELDA